MDIKLQDDQNNDQNEGMQPDMPPAEDVTPAAAPAPEAPAPAAEPMPAPAQDDQDDAAPAEGGEQAAA